MWSSAASDCSISIALAYNLHKRIANFNQKTDSILRKLILTGLRTAAFTAILSLVGGEWNRLLRMKGKRAKHTPADVL